MSTSNKARVQYDFGRYPFAASGTLEPGDLVVRPDGSLAVYDNMENAVSGDLVEAEPIDFGKIIEADATSAETWAAGDDIFWNASTKKMSNVAGAGKRVGKAVAIKASGVTKGRVNTSAPGNDGYLDAAQQALSGAGAITVNQYYTAWTTTGADAGTLADGTFVGQLKKVQLIVDGGAGTLTPVSLAGGTTITFADAGDYVILRWNGSNWRAIEIGNDADGATGPVLA